MITNNKFKTKKPKKSLFPSCFPFAQTFILQSINQSQPFDTPETSMELQRKLNEKNRKLRIRLPSLINRSLEVSKKIMQKVRRTTLAQYLDKEREKSRSFSDPTISIVEVDPQPSRKRAVLCGVSYKNMKFKLLGTINDVHNMKAFLIKFYGYSESCIRVLTEEEKDESRIPTKKNIENAMSWLVDGCEEGDSLVFFFSGHGLRKPDLEGDELDGFDETICPVDFMENGMIIDNDINSTIVRPLKTGVKLHAIVDACHSGTILDLLYVYDNRKKKWVSNEPPSGARKSSDGGLAISLSACEDDQFAADTETLTGSSRNGAMTYILIKVVTNNPNLTYAQLLFSMNEEIKRVNRQGFLKSKFLKRVFRQKVVEAPMLSSSERFNINEKKFRL